MSHSFTRWFTYAAATLCWIATPVLVARPASWLASWIDANRTRLRRSRPTTPTDDRRCRSRPRPTALSVQTADIKVEAEGVVTELTANETKARRRDGTTPDLRHT
jgi:hypothetical protein